MISLSRVYPPINKLSSLMTKLWYRARKSTTKLSMALRLTPPRCIRSLRKLKLLMTSTSSWELPPIDSSRTSSTCKDSNMSHPNCSRVPQLEKAESLLQLMNQRVVKRRMSQTSKMLTTWLCSLLILTQPGAKMFSSTPQQLDLMVEVFCLCSDQLLRNSQINHIIIS